MMPNFPAFRTKPYYDALKTWLTTSLNEDGTLKSSAVQSEVSAAIANNQTVADAAAAAVTDELATRDIPETSDVTLALSGTTGVSITNIRPGRIDARVRGLSTAASNNKATFDALAMEAGTEGKELWIPDGSYLMDGGQAASNLRLTGRGTIKQTASGTEIAPLIVAGGVTNVTIEGVGFDGSGRGSCVQVGTAGAGAPAEHVSIRQARFTGTATSGTHRTSGVAITRSRGLTVESCRFTSVFNAVNGYNPTDLLVAENTVYGSGGNAFGAVYDTNILDNGRGVRFINNQGYDLGRMGVEIWSAGGVTPIASPQIIGNEFFLLTATSGISEVTGIDAIIARNILHAQQDTISYGIEAGTYAKRIFDNEIYQFGNGIILNNADGSEVTTNLVDGSRIGLYVIDSADASLSRNRIRDTVSGGVQVEGAAGEGRIDVIENRVERWVSKPGDGTRTFVAYRIDRQSGFSRMHRNRAVQGQAAPTAGFAFRAFQSNVNAGELKASEFHGNITENHSASLTVTPFIAPRGATTASDADMQGNKSISSTGVVTAANTWV